MSATTRPTPRNTMGGERARNEGDAYYTPPELAMAICARLAEMLGAVDLIVEPSAGAGAFVRAARATWGGWPTLVAVEPAWTGLDLDPISLSVPADRLMATTWEAAAAGWRNIARTLILGNPPYNLPGDGRGQNPTTAERHVLLALDRLPEGGHVAFLLRTAFLGGGGRIERLHAKHPLRALWPVTPRPSFTGGGTDASEYAVFVWRKGWQGECDVRPLRWSGA